MDVVDVKHGITYSLEGSGLPWLKEVHGELLCFKKADDGICNLGYACDGCPYVRDEKLQEMLERHPIGNERIPITG